METVQLLPIEAIRPDERNPRRNLGDLTELAATLKGPLGLLQPVTVRPNGDGFMCVLGHKRHAAARLAGLSEIAAIVRDLDDEQALEAMLIENLQRTDLTPLEEASSYQLLLDAGTVSQHELAERIGRSQSHISKRIALLEVPEVAREAIDSGGITLEDALELRKLADHPKRVEKAIRAASNPYNSMKRAVADELVEQKRADEKQKAKDRAKSEGIKLVGYPTYGGKSLVLGKTDGALPFTKAQHKKEPCHAAALSPTWSGGKFVYVCTDIARHNAKGESKLKLPKDVSVSGGSPATRSGPSKADEAKRQALEEAAERRQAWLTKFVSEIRGRKIGKDELAAVIAQAFLEGTYVEDGIAGAAVALGLEEKRSYNLTPKVRAYIGESPANLQRFAFTAALFGAEHETAEVYGPRAPAWYVAFLDRHGYEWSDAEQTLRKAALKDAS